MPEYFKEGSPLKVVFPPLMFTPAAGTLMSPC